ncbi:MAG: NfeD family protein [Patescibacteria group bacterium]|jgi:membrane protein implicated in regulation of membrane protease activity
MEHQQTFWHMLGNDVGMMTFAVLGFIGGVFTLITLAFGHGDHNIDHDFSAGDHDFSAGDHDNNAGPNVFSFRNIMLFVTGFGGIGMLAKYHGASFIVSSLWGAFSGFIMAFVGYLIYRALYKSQATSHIDNCSLCGSIALVEQAIVANGMGIIVAGGEIGHLVRLQARTKEGTPVANGRQVRILNINGTEALVEAL